MSKLRFAHFDAFMVTIRMNVILSNVEKGNAPRAIKLIEDSIFHLEHAECPSDLGAIWRDKVMQLFLELELMIMCGASNIGQHVANVRDVLKENRWYTSKERWPMVMASRLLGGGDVGSLALLPNDILENIAIVVTC